jgi:DNA polymerase III alpha subunit
MTLADLQPLSKVPFHGVILPTFDVSLDQRATAGAKESCSNLEFLTQLCREGYKQKVLNRIPKDQQPTYTERVKFELDTINTLGFTDYILMVWDICRFADERKIPRGPGRGSVSSSLVCHLIGLTELDPIEYGLFFTRFLSKARAKSKTVGDVVYMDGGLVPDVDMDFDYYRRHEIFDYLKERYPGQTAHTLTTTTLTSKSLIMEVVKIFEGGSEEDAQAASDLVEKESGVPEEIEDAISDDPKKQNARFKEWAKDHREAVEIAMDISGLNKSEGQHASALLICSTKIDEIMPLQSATDDDGVRHTVSGYDMYSAQEICLKFDILGLKTLSVIDDVCRRVGIKLRGMDGVHDEAIYRTLQDFKHRVGIFQLETFAQGNAAAKVKPRDFEQLSAILAIARPGAFAYIDNYVKYVNEGVFQSVHPLIDPILKPTGGVSVYQEQYLMMLKAVGMHEDRAENARKVLGKKLKEKVPEVKAEILEVCKREGRPVEIVDLLLKIAEDAGGYAFAKAHAFSYAIITARCMYLKAHYPTEFYWAVLRMIRHESKKYEELGHVDREMRTTGFQLLPPQLSTGMDFEIEGDRKIRFALGMVRGVSDKSQPLLETFVGSGVVKEGMDKFSIFQALKNAGLNVGIGASLIQAGCMCAYDTYKDENGVPYRSRSRLVLELLTFNLLNDTTKKHLMNVGDKPEVNWDVIAGLKYLAAQLNDKGKPLIPEKSLNVIRRDYKPYADIYEMNRRNERLANYFYEKRVLGYSYSETLRSIFGAQVDDLSSVAEVLAAPAGELVRMIGFVADPFKGKTRKGNREFKFKLLDETGEIRVKAFNERIDLIEQENGGVLPIKEDLVILNGKVMDGDCVFVQTGIDGHCLGIQTNRIYTRLGDLSAKSKKGKKSAAAGEQKTASA